MKTSDIVNRIKSDLGKYTEDFNDVYSVTSLSRSSSTITAVSSTPHNLTTGDYILMKGAKEPIALTSINRVGTVATVVSSSDHKLSDPSFYAPNQLPVYVEISGASPSGYNGVFELLSVPNDTTFTFKITTATATPASTAGFLLLEDFDNYNGYKQITVIDSTSFSYAASNASAQSPAQGSISLTSLTRVAGVATPNKILDFYDEGASNILKPWMFVNLESEVVFRDGTIGSDITSSKKENEDFYYQILQNFSVYVVVPSQNQILGSNAVDKARGYRFALLKILANYQVPSDLVEVNYQPITYLGSEADDYIKAVYVHRFDFSAQGFIQSGDTTEFSPGVPLQLIDGIFEDNDMVYKPRMR